MGFDFVNTKLIGGGTGSAFQSPTFGGTVTFTGPIVVGSTTAPTQVTVYALSSSANVTGASGSLTFVNGLLVSTGTFAAH